MNAPATEQLEKTIQDFANTVDALGQIRMINEEIHQAASDIRSSGEGIHQEISSLHDLTMNLTDSVKNFNMKAENYTGDIKELYLAQEKQLASYSEALEKGLLELDKATQKNNTELADSIEKARKDYSDGLRDLREKQIESDTRLRTEMDNRFKTIDQLNAELTDMKKQQKIAKIFAALGFISALLATASSALHFFIK